MPPSHRLSCSMNAGKLLGSLKVMKSCNREIQQNQSNKRGSGWMLIIISYGIVKILTMKPPNVYQNHWAKTPKSSHFWIYWSVRLKRHATSCKMWVASSPQRVVRRCDVLIGSFFLPRFPVFPYLAMEHICFYMSYGRHVSIYVKVSWCLFLVYNVCFSESRVTRLYQISFKALGLKQQHVNLRKET